MILIILNKLRDMPKLSIVLKGLLVLFFILSSSVFFILKVNYIKKLTFNGEIISIKRNQYGIPHVKSETYRSALYGWGYVTAQDRLFQMSFKRLIGTGRLSQFLGERAINVDKMFRQLNFQYWSKKTAEKLLRQNETQYRNYQAYANGINDQVKSLNFLPIEFYLIGLNHQPWTVSDMFLMSKLLVWSQSQNHQEQYIRSSLLSKFSKQEVDQILSYTHQNWFSTIFNESQQSKIVRDQQIDKKLLDLTLKLDVPFFTPQQVDQIIIKGINQFTDQGRGSNSWVISGKYTKSGSPLIANDPHLENAIPAQWHQVKIQYRHENKRVFLQGGAMAGLPMMIGRSSYAATALTTIYCDSQDLYRQTITSSNSYMLDGKQRSLKIRSQVIKIKGQQPITYQVFQTHRGPLIHYIGHSGALYQLGNQNISLAWNGFHAQYDSFVQYTHFAQIQSVDQIKSLLERYGDHGPNMNFLYATKDNHIGYSSIGTIPLRRNPNSGIYVKDGSTSEHDWIGKIDREKKLSLHDPQKGYIVTANNKPASNIYQNGVYDLSIYTGRANRIQQLIKDKIKRNQKFTTQDMKNIQLDTIDIYCTKTLPYIIQAIPEANKYLHEFDCNFTKQSYQSTIYEVLFYQLFRSIQPMPEQKFNFMICHSFISYMQKFIREAAKNNNEDKQKILQKAWSNTISNLTDFFKSQKHQTWYWQKYHLDHIPHRPFSNSEILKQIFQRKFGGRGNIHTPNVAKMNKLSYGGFQNLHRANIRLVIGFNEPSYWLLDTGVSQKFYSKHYDDQYKHFTKDHYILMDEQSPQNQKDFNFSQKINQL